MKATQKHIVNREYEFYNKIMERKMFLRLHDTNKI